MGNREANVQRACEMLNLYCGTILRTSKPYYSVSWGYDSDHEYVNICVAIQTALSPHELLKQTQDIERALGRTSKTSVSDNGQLLYTDRTIDIDLLQGLDARGGEIIISTPELTLPHPRMNERPFVTIPLAEIMQ